jgi:hypothetical protein
LADEHQSRANPGSGTARHGAVGATKRTSGASDQFYRPDANRKTRQERYFSNFRLANRVSVAPSTPNLKGHRND